MDNLKNFSRQLNIEKSVNFRGIISEPESHLVFTNSTIFVLNSNYEGMTHAVLNAMNIGVSVITTPVGGNPEVVQNEYNGFLVSYNDKEAWFKTIIRLLEDKSLREKFSQNGKKILEKFRWSELIIKTIDVFNSVK
jgi:glycosyltransferase involved in cell wall biosynthesis